MSPQPALESEVQDEYEVWAERSSGMLYEVKLFSDYVLARPISHQLYSLIRKIDMATFASEFEEFYGDRGDVKAFMQGNSPEFIQGERR